MFTRYRQARRRYPGHGCDMERPRRAPRGPLVRRGARAAELAQHGGGHGSFQHHDGGFRHEGRRDYREEFRGHRSWYREGFEHQYWGWGYHRFYPSYYVSYSYEPVSVCSAYYFADDEGVWYCFTGE